MNRAPCGVALLAAIMSLTLASCTQSNASCAAVDADFPSTVQPGQTLNVAMTELFSACNDQGEGSNPAEQAVTVELVAQDDRDSLLATGTADVSQAGTATVAVAIPADASGTFAIMYDGESLGTVIVTD